MRSSFSDATDGFEPGTVYLSGKEKRAWAAAHTPWDLYSIKLDEKNRFGNRWVLDVTTIPVDEDEEAETRKIGLLCNDRRDRLMAQLQKSLADGGVIGPLELQLVEMEEEGTEVWTIQEWTGRPSANSASPAA